MFAIDLLKGKGLPTKSQPVLTAIAVVPILIPLMTVAVMAVCSFQNQIIINSRSSIIEDTQHKMSAFKNDLAYYTSINKQTAGYQEKLNIASKATQYRIQLTSILVQLTDNLPNDLMVTQFDLTRSDQRKKSSDPKTGNEKDVTSVQRKLKITVGGIDNPNTNQCAEQYVQSLRSSKLLSECFDGIQILSRSNGTLDGESFAFYEIECNFKEQY